MKQRRHTPEQVIRKLAEGEKLLNRGHHVAEVCPPLEESIRRHEGERRQASEGTREGERSAQAHRGEPGPRQRHVELHRRGKLLTPNRRRQAVALLELEFGVSQRRACIVIR